MQVTVSTVGSRTLPSTSRLAVETVADYQQFVSLESEWNETAERARIAHPFLRHEWIRTWWDSFGEGRDLRVIVVRSDGRIAAIAPLVVETARMYGLSIRRMRLMHNDHTPRADFIVAEPGERCYRALWWALMDCSHTWDVLQLGQLPGESTTTAWISELAAASGCTTGVWRSSESPFLELTGTWDQYTGRLTGKFRQNVRNRIARLRRTAEPQLEVIHGGTGLERAIADAVRLEESGWKRRAGTLIESDPAVHGFYRRFAERAAERGWLRLLFLTLAGRRIAASYSLRYGDRLFLCKTGYDPEFDTCSPFKVLTYFILRDAFAEGLVEVDFLGDLEVWKQEWTRRARSHQWLFVFSSAARARVIYPLKFKVAPAVRSIAARLTARPFPRSQRAHPSAKTLL